MLWVRLICALAEGGGSVRSDRGTPAWDKLQDSKTLLIHHHHHCTVMSLGLECRILLRETSESLSLFKITYS